MINIIIAEDDSDVRLSLVNILKTDSEICVIGEANNGLEAIALARKLLPNLILMDIKMPGIDGLEAAKLIKASDGVMEKGIKILMLSTFYDDDLIQKSQEYGVDGYLLKGFIHDKLATAIKNTYNGFVTLDRIIYEKQNKLTQEGVCKKTDFDLALLSKTELDILKLVVDGKKNAEIATALYLSTGTVRNNISSMFSKLGCKNGRDLAVFGIRAGL
jgi:DNA-binding NarL/FixJ family response regulator